ncbi:hypothetical protein [Acinetobacter puyangensis]|uniref:hypothetical protein n=1 Tax=Acinetobacter puyangensis TaxID=1096779 RepID=UPI003A4D5796
MSDSPVTSSFNHAIASQTGLAQSQKDGRLKPPVLLPSSSKSGLIEESGDSSLLEEFNAYANSR